MNKAMDCTRFSWTAYGGTSVSTDGQGIGIDGEEDCFGYLAGAAPLWLMPGVYELAYGLEFETGKISIGVQDRAGKRWLGMHNDISGESGSFSFMILVPRRVILVMANCNDGRDKRSRFRVRSLTLSAVRHPLTSMARMVLDATRKTWRLKGLPRWNGLRLKSLRLMGLFPAGNRLVVRQVVDGGYAVRSLAVHCEEPGSFLLSADVGDDRISAYSLRAGRLGDRVTIPFTPRSAPIALKPVRVAEGRDVTLVGLFNFDEGGCSTPDSTVMQLPPVRQAMASKIPLSPGDDCPVVLRREGHWGYRGMALVQQPSGEYCLGAVDRDQDRLIVLEGLPIDGVLTHGERIIELPNETEPIGIAPFPVPGSDRPAFVMTSRRGGYLVVALPDGTVRTIPLGDRSRSSVAVGRFRASDKPEVAVALWGGDPTRLNDYGVGSLAVVDPLAAPGESVVRVTAGVHPTDVACGDIDGDGLDEIVLLNYGVGLGPADRSSRGGVMVFKHLDGEFKCIQEIALPNPRIALVQDLDGDGLAEVVVSLFFERKLAVLKMN